jgi:PleD family two-component response regulator
VIAERFREAVERFDWSSEDAQLVEKPVKVDVGVVCLRLGTVGARRHIARQLAHDLLARADKLMYEAKGERATQVSSLRVRIDEGSLVEVSSEEYHPLDGVAAH